MNTLRWILGAVLVLVGGGFVVLSVIGGGFRKSFGASPVGPLVTLLPLLGMALLLAGLVWPSARLLLHAGAGAAVVLTGLCVWQIVAESATILIAAILYLALWLVFYWQAAWRAA